MSTAESQVTLSDPKDWLWLGMSVLCVLGAALAAGLTMGLLSLDTLKLKIKVMTGTKEERMQARALLPLLKDRHFLLCTLLIFNAACNEGLPIFIDNLVPAWLAVVLSVVLVLIFCEAVPTAFFTGPQQMKIAYKLSGVVRVLQFLLCIVSKPMALGLDYMLGSDHDKDETYSRDEIAAMVRILRSEGAGVQEVRPYRKQSQNDDVENALIHQIDDLVRRPSRTWHEQQQGLQSLITEDDDAVNESPLTHGEVKVITGVLGLAKICIADVLVPLELVNMLSTDHVFDQTTVDAIYNVGNSRFPVYQGTNTKHIIGVFLVKRLVKMSPKDCVPLQSLCQELQKPLVVSSSQSLLDVLTLFQQGQSHIALVSHNPSELQSFIAQNLPPSVNCEPIGIVTIADIFEAMIQSKIYDDNLLAGDQRLEGSIVLKEMARSQQNSFAAGSMSHADGQAYAAILGSLVGPGSNKHPIFTPTPLRVISGDSLNSQTSAKSSAPRGRSSRSSQSRLEIANQDTDISRAVQQLDNKEQHEKPAVTVPDVQSAAAPSLIRNPLSYFYNSPPTELNKKLINEDDDLFGEEDAPRTRRVNTTGGGLDDVGGAAVMSRARSDDVRGLSHHRRFDSLFDEMGVPLIQDAYGNNPTSTRQPSVAPQSTTHILNVSRFPNTSTSNLKPTILAKYIKTKRYAIDRASGASGTSY